MEPLFELKPNKTAFVKWRFALGTIIPLIILIALFIALSSVLLWLLVPALILFLIWRAFDYYSLTVAFRKEKYLFYPNKIIAKYGGIFHDRETELVIKNITHVKLVRPWLEYKFFKTGRVIVELAGSAMAEAVFNSVDKPEEAYAHMAKVMKENGFRLNKGRQIQKEKPSRIGVFFETMRIFFGTIFGFFFFGIYFFRPLISLVVSSALGLTIALTLVGLVLLWVLGHSVIRFLDLMKRVYYIYDDTIVYSEGFLTKVDSFIPIENLADSEITQTLIDKIFGLYDVRVSCQGAAHEILFKNMANGPAMEKNIDNLINQTSSLAGKKDAKAVSEQVKATKIMPGKTLPLNVEKGYTASFKMDMKRSIIGVLLISIGLLVVGTILFVIIPGFGTPIMMIGFFSLFGLIGVVIKVISTNYAIKPQGMMQKFSFLNMREIEFSNDKITGVIFSRNFIDEWFNTFSIKFWSIGASHDVNFSNIKEEAGLRSKVLAKFGITGKEQPSYTAESRFSIVEMLKANLGLTLLGLFIYAFMLLFSIANPLLLIVPILITLVIVAFVIYKSYYYKTSKIFFYDHYVYFKAGIFFKHYYYALYDNVKDIRTVRYPFSSLGSISFNIAGEALAEQQQRQAHAPGMAKHGQGMLIPHHFVMSYVPKISDKDELIDMIFYKRPTAQEVKKIDANIESYREKALVSAKPMLANSLLWTVLGLLVLNLIAGSILLAVPIFLPLLLLADIIILGFVIWSIKATSYFIEPYRIVAKHGIFYKTQVSIVFTKIDHLRSFQGLTHKIFGNGTVIVHTTGSSMPEITIRDIPKYKEFYSTLEKYY